MEKALELLAKIEAYAFECEAGPLANCTEWQELKALVLADVSAESNA